MNEPLADHPPAGQPRRHDLNATLKEMERQLHHHSALEDLGPLFGPQAQGREDSGQPTPPSSEP